MNNYKTKRLSAKQYRQKQAGSSEHNFETFCNNNRIKFIHLDKNKEARGELLKNSDGKSPDYLCQKDGQSIFVEIKTHTLLTNEARNKTMIQTIQAKKAAGLSGTTIFPPFDPTPELKTPFKGYLRKASKKFKNIKDKPFPRVLLLDGIQIEQININRIFGGFNWDIDKEKFRKTHQGLLDSTGSNVSALVYWNADIERYVCLANFRAQIPFPEENFNHFFS